MSTLLKIYHETETETAIVIGTGEYCYTTEVLTAYPNITNISLYGFNNIANEAFANCKWLETFSADACLNIINNNAFYYCTSLKTFIAPNLSNIDNGAFNGCYNLTTFLAPNITSLSTDVFSGCINLLYIYLTLSSVHVLGFNHPFPILNTFFYGTIVTIYLYVSPACYNKGTKILCLNKQFEEEYLPIENFKKGDIVKTYKHGYRKITAISSSAIINNPNMWNHCMYKMVKTEQNGLLEDLIVTGNHTILVDDLVNYKKKNDILFLGKTPKIDDKYLLLAAVSNNFKKIEDVKLYTYYHFILENNGDDEQRFGVWANGMLSETPSKTFFINWHLFKPDTNLNEKRVSKKILNFISDCYKKISK